MMTTSEEVGLDVAKEAQVLLNDIERNGKAFLEFVKQFTARITDGELPTSKGISFLELRNFTMLNYLIDLTFIVLQKCQGLSIEGNEAIDRLVENRTTLEKMKPIHQKLKYRIDKLVRSANTGQVNAQDPLNLRPKLDAIVPEDGEEDESEDEVVASTSKSEKSKSRVYVPPKVSAMHYDEDEPGDSKQQRLLDKAKRRALSSNVIQELRQEFDDAPEEINESSVGRKRENKLAKDRQTYEEDYLVRLQVPKSQQKTEGRHGFLTMSSLSRDLTRFDNVSVLDRDELDGAPTKKHKSSKGKKKTFGKKKFRKYKK